METIFVVTLKSYNFDECDSYTKEVIALHKTKQGAIESAETYVSSWCKNVKWDHRQKTGKVDIVGEIEINEMSIID